MTERFEIENVFMTREEMLASAEGAPFDFVHVTGTPSWSWPLPYWFLEKTARWTQRLAKLGYHGKALVPGAILPGATQEDMLDFLLHMKPRMVISRSFCLRGRDIAALATGMPDTILLQSNHTPNSYMLTETTSSPLDWLDSLDAARSFDNVYLSSVSRVDVDGLAPLLPEGKMRWIANPCEETRLRGRVTARPASDRPFTVGLGGRCNLQKNFKSQLDALAVLAQRHPVRVYLFLGPESVPGAREELRQYASRLLGPRVRDLRILDFVEQAVLRRIAQEELDAFLQVTMDESFGYLNWEMMSEGVPTVTTPGLDVLGTHTAEPTRPGAILDALEAIRTSGPDAVQHALQRAQAEGRRMNASFDAAFATLLPQQASTGQAGQSGPTGRLAWA